jgi:hypothetical protein
VVDLHGHHFVCWLHYGISQRILKTTYNILALVVGISLVGCLTPEIANGQDDLVLKPKSGAKAFGLSLLVPGLGHRYVNDGRWGGAGSIFVAADITLWLGLATTIAQENHFVDGYSTQVVRKAGNTLEGKNRSFELALASYDSSDEYLDALLRSRQWDRLDGAQDPDNQWNWETSQDRSTYVELRNDADSADRRTKALMGALIVNRLISGITAALSSRKTRSYPPSSYSAGLGYSRYSDLPVASLSLRF